MRGRHHSVLLVVALLLPFTGANTLLASTRSYDNCKRTDKFETQVIIQHEILNKKFTSDAELETLANTFKMVYNRLNAVRSNKSPCDQSLKRAVAYVKVEPMEMLYKQFPGQKGYFRDFLYKVTGECVGCAIDTSLFEFGKKSATFLMAKAAVADDSGCQCAADISEKEDRGPFEKDFKKVFKQYVSKISYDENGEEMNTEETDRVLEVEGGGTCLLPIDSYDLSVEMELSALPQGKDIETVQDAFINSYNYLAPEFCDYEGHTVTEFTLQPARRKLRRLGKKRLPGTGRGGCRNCGGGSGGYDDGSRRLSHEETRKLWQSSDCYCAIVPMGYRRPTVGEHAAQFNKTLIWARKEGYLSEDIYALDLVET